MDSNTIVEKSYCWVKDFRKKNVFFYLNDVLISHPTDIMINVNAERDLTFFQRLTEEKRKDGHQMSHSLSSIKRTK